MNRKEVMIKAAEEIEVLEKTAAELREACGLSQYGVGAEGAIETMRRRATEAQGRMCRPTALLFDCKRAPGEVHSEAVLGELEPVAP